MPKQEKRDITIDFDIYRWTLAERIDFEEVAGMTCDRAVSIIAGAGNDADSALDFPAKVQAAFVWIVARRTDEELTFADAARSFTGQDFIDAIPGDEEPAPLATEQRPTTAASSAPSATTSTTPRRKSGN